MKDMECPYCGASWESDSEDLKCIDNPTEYVCPECRKMLIMSGETTITYSSEKAEEHYQKNIEQAKRKLLLYEEKLNAVQTESDKKYYQTMIDIFCKPDIKTAEKGLQAVLKHNNEVTNEPM